MMVLSLQETRDRSPPLLSTRLCEFSSLDVVLWLSCTSLSSFESLS